MSDALAALCFESEMAIAFDGRAILDYPNELILDGVQPVCFAKRTKPPGVDFFRSVVLAANFLNRSHMRVVNGFCIEGVGASDLSHEVERKISGLRGLVESIHDKQLKLH